MYRFLISKHKWRILILTLLMSGVLYAHDPWTEDTDFSFLDTGQDWPLLEEEEIGEHDDLNPPHVLWLQETVRRVMSFLPFSVFTTSYYEGNVTMSSPSVQRRRNKRWLHGEQVPQHVRVRRSFIVSCCRLKSCMGPNRPNLRRQQQFRNKQLGPTSPNPLATFQYRRPKYRGMAVATYSEDGFSVSCRGCPNGWASRLALPPAPPGFIPVACPDCPRGWEDLLDLQPADGDYGGSRNGPMNPNDNYEGEGYDEEASGEVRLRRRSTGVTAANVTQSLLNSTSVNGTAIQPTSGVNSTPSMNSTKLNSSSATTVAASAAESSATSVAGAATPAGSATTLAAATTAAPDTTAPPAAEAGGGGLGALSALGGLGGLSALGGLGGLAGLGGLLGGAPKPTTTAKPTPPPIKGEDLGFMME